MKYNKFSIPKISKIYQNWHFWSENVASGNPNFKLEHLELLEPLFRESEHVLPGWARFLCKLI
jgi:hypothetical protein